MDTSLCESLDDTMRLAAKLAEQLRAGGVVALTGELGAGKTQFVRGLTVALGGSARDVHSPTYVLLHTYPLAGGKSLHHLDAYRVSGDDDFEAIGFGELLDATTQGDVICLEWPSRVEGQLPEEFWHVHLEHQGETTRRVVIDRVTSL